MPTAVAEGGALVGREQLVDRHVVEAGQALQAGHRDGPLAPLVGTEDRRLELQLGRRLDVLEREPLLATDGTQALADLPRSRSSSPHP